MRGYFRKKFIVVLLAVLLTMPVLSVGAASQATRDQLNELRRQQEAAGQQVREQENILAGTQLEMSRIMEEIAELDQQIIDVTEALEAIELDLLATEIRIADAEKDLEIAQAERDLQSEILRERIRVMHEQGSVGLLEVLFQAENIADFFLRWEHIRAVIQFDQDLLSRLEESETRVNANLEDLSRSHMLVQDLQYQAESTKQDIELKMEEKYEFFATLHENAEKYAEFLDILQEEANAINIEFGQVQSVYRAEVAAAERARREELDRQRRAAAAAAAAERNSRLAELNSFESFAWPLAIQGVFTSGFGNRPDPFTGRTTMHQGIDISAAGGTRINAAEAGYVRIAGWSASYGNYIVIDHADGYSTLYAHNSRNRVTVGQRVTRGQHIGDVGSTGHSTGNHLHFEIRLNGVHLDPMGFFR
jgi:murein DD-endopeptidase MepM/ murein hydrolase activator NlpD